VTWEGVVSSLGIAGTLNIAGRAVFVEVGKALSWGTGSVWALAALCAVGATTAGLQTYILGLLAIEIAQNGGQPLDAAQAGRVIATAKETMTDFVAEMRQTKPCDPGLPSAEAWASVEQPVAPSADGNGAQASVRALSAIADAGSALRDAAAHAADTIGSGASHAGSAVRGFAAGAAGAVGSALQRKPEAASCKPGSGLETGGEIEESPDA
jgi:hypothetical protein